MFLKLEAKILWEKFLELHHDYLDEMTDKHDKFNQFYKVFKKYVEKYKLLIKKQSRLSEKIKNLETNDLISKFATTQKKFRFEQYSNTSKKQVDILNSFISFNKKVPYEASQSEAANLLHKIFANEAKKNKLSEDNKILMNYFISKYPKKEQSTKKELDNFKTVPSLDLKSLSNEKSRKKSPAKTMKLNSTRNYESEKISEKKTKIFGEEKKVNEKSKKRNPILEGNKKQNLNKSLIEKSNSKNQ
jgi:hypothetical protein